MSYKRHKYLKKRRILNAIVKAIPAIKLNSYCFSQEVRGKKNSAYLFFIFSFKLYDYDCLIF